MEANAEELASTLPGEQFDLVYSFGVIHHTPHPERALAQMRQLAAPGATLKLMVYHRRSWKVFWILATQEHGRFWNADERIAKHAEAQLGCPVAFTYSRREGRALVERAGFRVDEVKADHVFPYRVQDYVQYRYVKEPYFRVMPAPAVPQVRARVRLASADHRAGPGVKVAVVGLGKLGAPLAAVLASKGHDVLGIDVSPEAVRLLERGIHAGARAWVCRTSSPRTSSA